MQKNLKYYVALFQDIWRYDFVQDINLHEILYLFSGYISYIYYEDIVNGDLEEELKEIKAHSIFVYLWSIIEAVCYDFVQQKLWDEKSRRKYLEVEIFRKIQKIKETEKLYVCKLEHKEISFNSSINFHSLIKGLQDKKLIENTTIKKIDTFRKMRNLVHINAFIQYDEVTLIKVLKKAFIEAKEILDELEAN